MEWLTSCRVRLGVAASAWIVCVWEEARAWTLAELMRALASAMK